MSGSFFKTQGTEGKRRKELPERLLDSMSIDEFCATYSSETSSSSAGKIRLHPRFFSQQANGKNEKRLPALKVSPADNSSEPSTSPENKPKCADDDGLFQKSLNREAIAEMDRQYDHNICLDRFINELEHQQQPSLSSNGDSNDEELSNIPEGMQCTCESDMTNSDRCPTCTSGSSSVAPRSNDETDSGSRKSDSLESSNNGNGSKEEKDVDPLKLDDELLESVSSEVANNAQNSDNIESGIDVNSSSLGESSSNSAGKNYKGGKLGRKRKRGYIYDPKPFQGKPAKKKVPEAVKDTSYWEKRKRNNEAARKSREMRRKKETEISYKLSQLKNENEALRVAIALLIKRNETLEYVLEDQCPREHDLNIVNIEMPVTCC